MASLPKKPIAVGSMANQCPTCGCCFGGLQGFDRHRVGPYSDRRCMTPEEMSLNGLTYNPMTDKWALKYGSN